MAAAAAVLSISEWLLYGEEEEVMSEPMEGAGEMRSPIAGGRLYAWCGLLDISLDDGLYIDPPIDE